MRGLVIIGALVLAWAVGAQAQAPTGAGGGLAAHDKAQPIEITADRLEVEQAANRATFEGNVQAVQGDLSLRADRLEVIYALDGSDAAGGQAVRRIEASGNVRLASPEETAKGGRGSYDVATGTIVLEEEVVLTRGNNIVEGSRLDIDLNTQKAVMAAGGDGRVRALFVPSDGGS